MPTKVRQSRSGDYLRRLVTVEPTRAMPYYSPEICEESLEMGSYRCRNRLTQLQSATFGASVDCIASRLPGRLENGRRFVRRCARDQVVQIYESTQWNIRKLYQVTAQVFNARTFHVPASTRGRTLRCTIGFVAQRSLPRNQKSAMMAAMEVTSLTVLNPESC
jgi:hypothetical protein